MLIRPQVKLFHPPERKIEYVEGAGTETYPYICVADLESYLAPTTANIPIFGPNSRVEHVHRNAAAAAMLIGGPDETLVDACLMYNEVGREDALTRLILQLEEWATRIVLPSIYANMTISLEERAKLFAEQTLCCICRRRLHSLEGRICVEHSHITGRVRGLAHAKCNLRRRMPRTLPIFLHNMGSYDAHFIVQTLAAMGRIGRTSVIAKTSEKYMRITVALDSGIRLVFLDSYLFLSRSLASLCDSVSARDSDAFLSAYIERLRVLPVGKAVTQGSLTTRERIELLRRKSVFPYEHLAALHQLREPHLPPKSQFYSSLTQCTISDVDYAHALEVYRRFECESLGEYMNLYLLTDVLLLAMVVERFRGQIRTHFGLDPPHFVSTPQLAWQACLKLTKAKLDYIPDEETLAFVNAGVRGGYVQVGKRYAHANNPYMRSYDPASPTSYISYFDCARGAKHPTPQLN